jgi:hypothetical protein
MFVQQSQESDFVSENVIWLGTSEPELVIVHSLKVPIIEKLQPQPPQSHKNHRLKANNQRGLSSCRRQFQRENLRSLSRC